MEWPGRGSSPNCPPTSLFGVKDISLLVRLGRDSPGIVGGMGFFGERGELWKKKCGDIERGNESAREMCRRKSLDEYG